MNNHLESQVSLSGKVMLAVTTMGILTIGNHPVMENLVTTKLRRLMQEVDKDG